MSALADMWHNVLVGLFVLISCLHIFLSHKSVGDKEGVGLIHCEWHPRLWLLLFLCLFCFEWYWHNICLVTLHILWSFSLQSHWYIPPTSRHHLWQFLRTLPAGAGYFHLVEIRLTGSSEEFADRWDHEGGYSARLHTLCTRDRDNWGPCDKAKNPSFHCP